MLLSQLPGIRGQRDVQWSNVELGQNTDPNFNIGNYGCLVTSIANYLWAIDPANLAMSNPGLVNNALLQFDGFDGGNVKWEAVNKSLDTRVAPQGVTSDIHTLADWLAGDDHYAFVQVTGPNFPQHWLMGYGVQDGGEPLALDPWYADSVAVRARYTFVEAHLYGSDEGHGLPPTTPQPELAPEVLLPVDAPTKPPVVEIPSDPDPEAPVVTPIPEATQTPTTTTTTTWSGDWESEAVNWFGTTFGGLFLKLLGAAVGYFAAHVGFIHANDVASSLVGLVLGSAAHDSQNPAVPNTPKS